MQSCLRQARLAGGDVMFSRCLLVRPSVRSILMPIGTSDPRGMKR